MGTPARLLLCVTAWLLLVGAAALGISQDQSQRRDALIERFANRADTGADFVGSYVEDVFATQTRLIELLERDAPDPRTFVELTELAGFEAAVVLDEQGRVTAVVPSSPKTIGLDLSDRPHLTAALGGERAVSDVTFSAVEQLPIVAFAQPLEGPEQRVFSAGFDATDSPLFTLLARQPITGTRGYLLDSANGIIIAAGDGARESVPAELTQKSLAGPTMSSGYVVASAPVPGTPWSYMIEAPEDSVLKPIAGLRSEWIVLGVFALIGLALLLFANRVMSTREQARREKAAADEQLRLTVKHAPIGMAMLDLDQHFVEPNAKLCDMLGRSADELEQLRLEDVTHSDDAGLDEELLAELLTGISGHYEVVKRLVTGEGRVIEGRTSVSVVRDVAGDPKHFVAQIEDVTEVRAAQLALQQRAHYDLLTDLPNRSLLLERLTEVLADDETASRVAVAFCDLDDFKQINDTDGHNAGDQVIREVAHRLRRVVRDQDLVGRMGGDEFVVVLTDIHSPDEAEHVMERARRAIEQPIVLGSREHRVSLSGGLAFAVPGDSATRLLSNADLALYNAKHGGRNRVEIYTPSLRTTPPAPETVRTPDRRRSTTSRAPRDTAAAPGVNSTELIIRAALEQDRVALAYQPVFDLTTGLMVAVEALLRLRDANGVVISPYDVIGVAEQSELITDIGWRVLQLAATQCGAWRDGYGVIVPVAVNVSAAQLGSTDFPTDVLAAVDRAGLPPHALTLELTETVMLSGMSSGSDQLHELRTAGFELAIDDFGTGYASLSYLHELPASALKIDQTFVSGLPEDRRSVAIVAGVVALARHCGIACIAEGIETEAQREHLAGLGVLGQGYLLGLPEGADAIASLIEQGRTDLPGRRVSVDTEAPSTSLLDAATGAFWRDPGMKELDREVARARRSATSLVLAFVRVEVDDPLDREAADQLLVKVATALRARLRPYDLVVRYREDELVCAVVGTPLAEIDQRLIALADEISELPGHGTLEIGSAEMAAGESLEGLVARVNAGFHDRASVRR